MAAIRAVTRVADLDEVVANGGKVPGSLLPAASGGTDPATLGVDLWSLSANPASVTDWGPVVNAAIAGGTRLFVVTDHAFPFSTPVAADGTVGVSFRGSGGMVWPGDQFVSALAGGYLLWKGAGSGAAITATDSTGFTLKDTAVYYDNPGFTGTLVKLSAAGHNTQKALIENTVIRSTPASGLRTARAALSLDQTIVSVVNNCVLGYAQYGITGVESTFANAIRVLRNTFDHVTAAAIGNTGDQWLIDGNTFEMSGATGPAVIGCIGSMGGNFVFSNNWVGDYDHAGVPFAQGAGNLWDAAFTGNSITVFGTGLIWQFGGPGRFTVAGNPNLVNGGGAILDLVNANTVKELVWFGNTSAGGSVNEAVLNRDGHRLHLIGADASAIMGVHEIVRDRLAYPPRVPTPSASAGAALGAGGSVTVWGSDAGGQLGISGGTSGLAAGTVLDFAFGTPKQAINGSPAGSGGHAMVFLQPYLVTGALDHGLYVSAVSDTGFQLAVKSALNPGENVYVFYRVTWM